MGYDFIECNLTQLEGMDEAITGLSALVASQPLQAYHRKVPRHANQATRRSVS